MATLYSPKIVTDGLVMYLDAANPRSYPRSGTAWNDISGNNITGTRTNAGDIWTIRVTGNILSAYYNGNKLMSVTDNTYASGQPGMFYVPDNIRATTCDNFKARNIRNTFTITSTGTRGRVIGRST